MATLILPYTAAKAVTLHDTNSNPCVAFYVGGAGNLAVTTANGDNVTLNGLLAGHIYPIQCTVMKATGSTATNIVALF